jgi:hypothetical protein
MDKVVQGIESIVIEKIEWLGVLKTEPVIDPVYIKK